MRRFFTGICLCACFNATHAQSLYEVALEEKVANSTLIAEGRVVRQQSFWNDRHTLIFTTNTIVVSKVFKGQLSQDTIEVLTTGGTVGNDVIHASDLLELETGQVGIFFCHPNTLNLKAPGSKRALHDVYASSQGFYAYDLAMSSASAPFVRYDNIVTQLYTELQAKTGRAFTNLNPAFKVEATNTSQRTQAVSITSFSPASVNAGALLTPGANLLTINGSGFGTASGSAAILFDDANNGTGGTAFTVAYNDPLVVSWSDAQIQVRVPSRAGTGTFQVRDATGGLGSSPSSLYVNYSMLNASFNVGSLVTKEVNLMNTNGSGGYTLVYSTNTANSGVDFDASTAKATFQRALSTWKEVCGLNFIEGGTTSVQAVGGDGVNVVMFDNSATGNAPLPSGVLGVCYSFFSMCGSPAFEAQRIGFDIVIRNSGYSIGSTTFTIGPCPPLASNVSETDLETVILHELGHALNLGHINDSYQGGSAGAINPGKLMNFAVVNSVKRVSPDFSAKAGADYAIQPQGNTYGSCGLFTSEMTPLVPIAESLDECPGSFPNTSIPQNTSIAFDLVHATSNLNTDPAYTQLRCDGVGAALTNNAYYAFRTNSAGGDVNISVLNYTTLPGTLSSCPQVYVGIPTHGIRLSLYQANACPTAGAFGLPIACRSFTANGSLATITGLTANTRYLLMVEGIENTKATFNLLFNGTALPIRFSSFTGKSMSNYNELVWKAEEIVDVEKLVLQKTIDGSNFSDFYVTTDRTEMRSKIAKDENPFDKTYYRLKAVNLDGSVNYSAIISLLRPKRYELIILSNPADRQINVQVSGMTSGTYQLKLFSAVGQLAATVNIPANTGRMNIPVGHLADGMYQLVLFSKGVRAETHKVLIRH